MEITTINGFRAIRTSKEENLIYDVQSGTPIDGTVVFIAKEVKETNLDEYFREITPAEAAQSKTEHP